MRLFNYFANLAKRLTGTDETHKKLDQILEDLKKIMSTQEEFDKKLGDINAGLDAVKEAIAHEAAQVKAYIDAHQAGQPLDISALDGVANRLQETGAMVGSILVDPAPPGEVGEPAADSASELAGGEEPAPGEEPTNENPAPETDTGPTTADPSFEDLN